MSTDVEQARKAVRRGGRDEALVFLWNALEPARLAGDASALATIGQLARTIAEKGDASQRRDAERLLERLEATVAEGAEGPATARLDADLSPVGEKLADEAVGGVARAPGPVDDDGAPESAGPRGGIPFGTILWFLIVAIVILLNVLGRFDE